MTTAAVPPPPALAPSAMSQSTAVPSGPLVNVGCGRQLLPGFVNLDIDRPCDVVADARRRLPLADGSVRGVYSEHFLEHLSQGDGMRFLRECRRVLQPGGRLRIAMPDLAELVARYGRADWRADADMFRHGFGWVQDRCEMFNLAMREWGHLWLYDEEALRRAAALAGLRALGRCARGASTWPAFCGLETRPGSHLVMEFERLAPIPRESTPLVSILIPAYKPQFFAECLRSALGQTYPRLEVVVCDDDPTGSIGDVVRAVDAEERVRYVRNQPRRGGMWNYAECYAHARGELVKFLNDDDVLAPQCVARMVDAFRGADGVTAVTSYRQTIDRDGKVLADGPASRPLARHDVVLDGLCLSRAMLRTRRNLAGEPTCMMFRADSVRWTTPHLMSFGGSVSVGVGDVALWLNLLSQGDVVYLVEPLSRFRVHAGQRTHDADVRAAVASSWQELAFHARRLGVAGGEPGIWVRTRRPGSRRGGRLRVVGVHDARRVLGDAARGLHRAADRIARGLRRRLALCAGRSQVWLRAGR